MQSEDILNPKYTLIEDDLNACIQRIPQNNVLVLACTHLDVSAHNPFAAGLWSEEVIDSKKIIGYMANQIKEKLAKQSDKDWFTNQVLTQFQPSHDVQNNRHHAQKSALYFNLFLSALVGIGCWYLSATVPQIILCFYLTVLWNICWWILLEPSAQSQHQALTPVQQMQI